MADILTVESLKSFAADFVVRIQNNRIEELVGVTDGKAVGTYLEHHFKTFLERRSIANDWGNSAHGIDLPTINTDIKFTSVKQPQSSLPYRDSKQKIFGLGYNLIVFVYHKDDSLNLNVTFPSVSFISKERTADYMLTKNIRTALSAPINANEEDIYALLKDRNLPGDDITYNQIVTEIMSNIPQQGYLTISNALQWRAQYRRVIDVAGTVKGVEKVYAK